jgi:phosphoenolpyruvate synthase/pyruvate phosphate dikinase
MPEVEFLWLGDADCHVASMVGGKAANLSILAADYLVPPGFCIPPSAFEATERLGTEVETAYAALAESIGTPEPGVAVRSSGIDEDGQSASLAGLHDTFLNVTGAQAVGEAALKCLASAFTDRAIGYRRDRGIDGNVAGLAVLVQHLIPADVSAVAFSADPVTGDRSHVVINANWGLGETIASGSVTPDTFVVNKDGMALAESRVSEKSHMAVPVPGGIKEVGVPKMMRQSPCLDEARAVQIGELAVSLEQRMGYPVDVECAFKGDTLYLLQCRPVTTLA